MLKRRSTQGMQVLTSDGEFLGTVEDVNSNGFMIRRSGSDSPAVPVPEPWIADIDERVHLNRTGAEANAGWQAMQFRKGDKAAPEGGREPPHSTFSTNLAIFLALLAVVVFVILALMM